MAEEQTPGSPEPQNGFSFEEVGQELAEIQRQHEELQSAARTLYQGFFRAVAEDIEITPEQGLAQLDALAAELGVESFDLLSAALIEAHHQDTGGYDRYKDTAQQLDEAEETTMLVGEERAEFDKNYDARLRLEYTNMLYHSSAGQLIDRIEDLVLERDRS